MESVQNYLKFIEKEQEGFKQVLDVYLPKNAYKNPRCLSVCSGIANEEPLLFQHFGKGTELVSIDHDPSLEALVKQLNRKSLVIGDIKELDKYVKGEFDIILGRNVPLNPNHDYTINKVPDYWPEFFESLTEFMHKDTKLFLTLVREDEFYRAETILSGAGYRLNIKEENRVVVPSDYIGVKGSDTKDDYIIVCQSPLQLRLF